MGLAWEEVYLRTYLVHKIVLNFPLGRHLVDSRDGKVPSSGAPGGTRTYQVLKEREKLDEKNMPGAKNTNLPPRCHPACLRCLLLFSCSVVSDSLWPHGLQRSRLPCPSLSPGVCSKSCIGRIVSHLKFLNAVIWADQKYFLYQPFTWFKVPLSAFPEMPSGGGHFFLELILLFERRQDF